MEAPSTTSTVELLTREDLPLAILEACTKVMPEGHMLQVAEYLKINYLKNNKLRNVAMQGPSTTSTVELLSGEDLEKADLLLEFVKDNHYNEFIYYCSTKIENTLQSFLNPINDKVESLYK